MSIIDMYKLRACINSDEMKKLSSHDKSLVKAFDIRLNKKIEEMDQLNLFDVMEADNEDEEKAMYNTLYNNKYNSNQAMEDASPSADAMDKQEHAYQGSGQML